MARLDVTETVESVFFPGHQLSGKRVARLQSQGQSPVSYASLCFSLCSGDAMETKSAFVTLAVCCAGTEIQFADGSGITNRFSDQVSVVEMLLICIDVYV